MLSSSTALVVIVSLTLMLSASLVNSHKKSRSFVAPSYDGRSNGSRLRHKHSNLHDNLIDSSSSRTLSAILGINRGKRSSPPQGCLSICVQCFLAGEHSSMEECMTLCWDGSYTFCPTYGPDSL